MKTKSFSTNNIFFFVFALLVLSVGAVIYYLNQMPQQSEKAKDLFSLLLLLCGGGAAIFLCFLYYLFHQSRRSQQALYQTAYTDPITYGPTWSKAKQDISVLLEQNPQKKFAFVIFDINKFKILNERLGYLQANEVLRQIGLILRESLQPTEMFCRVQADIFQMLLVYQTPEQLKNRLEILNEKIINTTPIEKNSFQMILSFGVYFINQNPSSINDLLVKAALARDTIKGKYDNIVGFYSEHLQKQLQLEQEIENHMEEAISKGNFHLTLSPIRRADGSLYGAEVSLRWVLPPYGEIPEKTFRKVFTKNGFIYRLDLYVVEKVCQFQRSRIQEKKDLFPVFINLSSESLQSPQFGSILARLVKKYQLDSGALILQADPQNEISQPAIIQAMAHRLHEEGFSLSLDQAGKGYSSLELLKILPLQMIKIEEEAVADLEQNERVRRLADSLIYTAKQLKVKIIFSGVSSKKQWDILRNLGADFMMGPINGPKVSLQESDRLLKDLEL